MQVRQSFVILAPLCLIACQSEVTSDRGMQNEHGVVLATAGVRPIDVVDREVGPQVQLTAQLGGVLYSDTARIVHVATTLYNPTGDTLRFLSMSCSYENMFLVGENDGYVVRSRYDCYSNVPMMQTLAPGAHLDQFIMIAALDKSTMIHKGKLKIGMMWLDPREHRDIFSAYRERAQLAKTVWSNELDLERLYRVSYN